MLQNSSRGLKNHPAHPPGFLMERPLSVDDMSSFMNKTKFFSVHMLQSFRESRAHLPASFAADGAAVHAGSGRHDHHFYGVLGVVVVYVGFHCFPYL